MNSITVDSLLHQSLPKVTGLTEIRDTDGKILGYYAPLTAATKVDAATYTELAARTTAAELKSRKDANEREYTTAEVLEHLESFGK